VAYANIPFWVNAVADGGRKRAVKFKKYNMQSFSEQ
jgi:hypothetical protein